MVTTSDTAANSELAAARLREIAHYMDKHAESLVGECDDVYVLEGGLRVSFVIERLKTTMVPTIEVTKEYIVHERE